MNKEKAPLKGGVFLLESLQNSQNYHFWRKNVAFSFLNCYTFCINSFSFQRGVIMDAQQFEVLSKKLDTIIALLAIDKEKLGEKNKTEAILYLNELGLDNNTVALATGSTAGAVAVRLSEAKKAKGVKKTKNNIVPADTVETEAVVPETVSDVVENVDSPLEGSEQ